jgi:hypothetical protein
MSGLPSLLGCAAASAAVMAFLAAVRLPINDFFCIDILISPVFSFVLLGLLQSNSNTKSWRVLLTRQTCIPLKYLAIFLGKRR